MKKGTFLFTSTVAFGLLTMASVAQADKIPDPALVEPLSTFTFDVSGFNSAGTTGYLLTPDETATFGATTTFTAAGIDGQNITVTSSETVGLTTTTDTFTVSTPTSFVTTAKVNGTTIAAVQLDIGNANAGGGTVTYLTPVPSGYTLSAYLLYEGATQFSYTPATADAVFTNNNTSLAVGEGVNFGSAADAFDPNTLSFSITYPTVAVPEPTSMALVGLGLLGGAAVAVRRRQQAA